MVSPVLVQLKLFGEAVKVKLQLSSEPLSISFPVIVLLPFASNSTVMFLQTAVGSSLSVTVTSKLHDAVLPSSSSTSTVTVVVPTGNNTP